MDKKQFKKYKNIKFNGIIFVFKYDECPITGDNLFHIYVRHNLMPKDAIAAFFNASKISFNQEYNRWEAYSEVDNITILYFYLEENKIFVISAYYEN